MATLAPAGVGRRVAEGIGLAAARLPTAITSVPGGRRISAASGLAERRRMVASHLRRACGPSVDDATLARFVDATFASYARYWAESLRLPALGTAEVEAGMSYQGMGQLYQAVEAGRGVILALPHLGGWEWGGMWLARTGIPISVVVEALEPPEVFEWFAEFRSALGMEVIANGPDAAASCARALRQGRVLCLLSDRVVGGTPGVDVEFFGETTRIPAGPVTLALRTKAPLLPAAVYFTPENNGHLALVRPALPITRGSGRLRDDIVAGTQLLAGELEALIRRDPTQWHMMQPNWPSDLQPNG